MNRIIVFLTNIVIAAMIPACVLADDFEIAESQYQQYLYSEALASFQSYVAQTAKQSKSPKNLQQAYLYMGKIALAQGDTGDAKNFLEQALMIAPNSPEELILAGDVYCAHALQVSIFSALSLGKSCIEHYEKAVEVAPEHIEALSLVIEFHLEAPGMAGGSMKKARRYLQQLSEVSEEAARIYKVYFAEEDGEHNQALSLAIDYSRLNYQHSEHLYELARYFTRQQQFDVALSLFAKIPQLPKSQSHPLDWFQTDALYQQGDIYLATGRLHDAINLLESYRQLNQDPYDRNYYWARWSLAKAYYQDNQLAKYQSLVTQIQAQPYTLDEDFTSVFDAELAQRVPE